MNKTQNIIISLYKVWLSNGCKAVHYDSFNTVYKLIELFKHIDGVANIECNNKSNHILKDLFYKDFDLVITTKEGDIIEGYIRCCKKGLKKSYYIITSFWNENESKINESLSDGLNGFINMLSDINNFVKSNKKISAKELFKFTKHYIGELATIGLFLTCILVVLPTMDDSEYEDLAYMSYMEGCAEENNNIYTEPEEYYTDDEAEENTDWELVSDSVHTTIYHAVPEQCKKDVSYTASMFKLNHTNVQAHKIIAMERTMMQRFRFHYGDLVKIEGTDGLDGIYQIQDTMNKRFAGQQRIDILVNTNIKYGQWRNVKLYKLKNFNIAKNLKDDMLDALNQNSLDKRQTQYK